MKPRLDSAALTVLDAQIHWRVTELFRARHGGRLFTTSLNGDRRDADRMLRIMRLGCRFCGANSQYGEAHERDCIYETDPTRRQVWHRKGARIIE